MEKINKLLFTVFLLIFSTVLFTKDIVSIALTKPVLIGGRDVFFADCTSVCEDKKGNVFVLDSKINKIYKFSKNGKYLYSFGHKGVGPGDINKSHTIYINTRGNLIVNQTRDFIPIFDTDGKHLKYIKIPLGVGIYYITDNLFYGTRWNKKGKEQFLFNHKKEVINTFFTIDRDAFSISVPDKSGRLVMYNYFSNAYSPFFIYYNGKDISAIAVSNKYKVFIINKTGKIINIIEKKGFCNKMKKRERLKFIAEIKKYKKFTKPMKKKFILKIPEIKNCIDNILISNKYIWIIKSYSYFK